MINLPAFAALGLSWSIPAVTSQACNPGIEYFQLEGFLTAATVSDGPLAGVPEIAFPQEVCSSTCCERTRLATR